MKKLIYFCLLVSNIITLASYTPDTEHSSYDEDTFTKRPDHTIPNRTPQPFNLSMQNDTFDDVRAPGAPVPPPNSIWTQPLIIDNNNPTFNNTSIYQFQSNIIYNPGLKYVYPTTYTDYPAAIIVAKDNMTIDLNGFNLSLSQASSPNFLTNSPTYGIAIYQGVKNLKIISSTPANRKGSITNFSGYAIYGGGATQSYNTYDLYSNYIKNLVIDNLLITQNINGVYVVNGIQITITNTQVIYNFSPRFLFGIRFGNVLNGFVNLCRINQNYSFADIIAIDLLDTVNTHVQNCQVTDNRAIQDGNATGIKISGLGSNNILSSTANTIEACEISRNLCTYTANKKSIGINITDGSLHNLITDCSSTLHGNIPSIQPPPSPAPVGIGIQLHLSNFNQVNNNRCGYNNNYGISDTQVPSTSFFTKNFCALNLVANYNVMVPNLPGSPVSLPTIVLTSGDLSGYTGAGPILSNLETQVPA